MNGDLQDRLHARIEALSESDRKALAKSLEASAPMGRTRLVAYVASPGMETSAADIGAFARSRLPGYLVPDHIVVLEALPRTPAGKLDRRALSALADGADRPESTTPPEPGGVVAPRSEAERILADIWKAVLDTDEVDVRDDFFELGGDSILSIRVISRANQAGLTITPEQFFEAPTIAALAAAAEGKTESV